MKKLAGLLGFALVVTFMSPVQSFAAAPKAGATCTKLGLTSIAANKKFTCIKSGKKLVWDKGVLIVQATPTSAQVFYVPKDKTEVYKVSDSEGCAVAFDGSGKEVTFATLWASIDGKWLQVKTQENGWEKTCNDPRLPDNKYFAFAKAAVDIGTKLRWKFVGPVNIFERDAQGIGYSQPFIFTAPPKPLKPNEPIVPNPVEGGYGITWQNITQRVADISAASWTDAQATINRNKGLTTALAGYKSYISPGALATDPKIGEIEILLNRTFSLFARIPAPKNVIFVATTQEERLATKTQIDRLYPDSDWIKIKLDDIYGINTDQPAGSVFTQTSCKGSDAARSVSTYPDGMKATALIISVCPDLGNSEKHITSVFGMSHEYIHSIQVAVLVNVLDREKYEPCWLREGAAEWGQAAVANNFDEYLSNQHLRPYLLTSNGLQYEQTAAKTWTTEEVDSYLKLADKPSTCGTTNQYALAYSLGAAATEALVSIGGSESFFALQLRLANGQTSNQAFQAVYGKPWDEIRPILAEVVARKITLAWTPQALTYQTRPAR